MVVGQARSLKMPGVVRVFEALARQAREEHWGYEEFLHEVLSAEQTSRCDSAVRHRLREAPGTDSWGTSLPSKQTLAARLASASASSPRPRPSSCRSDEGGGDLIHNAFTESRRPPPPWKSHGKHERRESGRGNSGAREGDARQAVGTAQRLEFLADGLDDPDVDVLYAARPDLWPRPQRRKPNHGSRSVVRRHPHRRHVGHVVAEWKDRGTVRAFVWT
jgi:hypothetical protein